MRLGLIGRDDELGELDQFMAGCGRYALAAGMFLQTVLRACRPGRRRLRAGIRRRWPGHGPTRLRIGEQMRVLCGVAIG